MDHQPTKSYNAKGGKNRLRFASAKSRAKQASADVYRGSISDGNRLSNRSSTAVREKRVHDSSFRGDGAKKKKKRAKNGENKDGVEEEEEEEEEVRYFGRDNDAEGLAMGRTAVIVSSKSKLQIEAPQEEEKDLDDYDALMEDVQVEEEDEDADELITGGTIFLTELEVSAQRNGSNLFQHLVRQLRPVSKSIAELLHHAERIVDLLVAYLLSPRGEKHHGMATPGRRVKDKETWKAYKKHLASIAPDGYVANVATNDVLHLLGVLARELREEIYPYLHTRILPRIINDMLNPHQVVESATDKQQQVVLDVSLVESAFRALSYLYKYNADRLLNNGQQTGGGDADVLRQYYGKTICHRRDIVRRLAAESYAPILRKCTEGGLNRHLMRTLKALAGSLAAADDTTSSAKRARADATDGVSALIFETARGAPGRVHSKTGRLAVRSVMDCLVGFAGTTVGTKKKKDKKKKVQKEGELVLETNKARAVYEVASRVLYKLRGHVVIGASQGDRGEDVAATAFVEVAEEMHRALDAVTSALKEPAEVNTTVVNSATGNVIDLMTETINFQEGRLLASGREIDRVVNSLQSLLGNKLYSATTHELQDQILQYLCSAWKANPTHTSFALRLGKFFPSIVGAAATDSKASGNISGGTGDDGNRPNPALFLARNLLPFLPKKVASKYLIPALLGAAASASGSTDSDSSLVLLHTISTTVWPRNDLFKQSADIDLDDAAADALFSWEAAEYCPDISQKLRSSLFDVCLIDDTKDSSPLEIPPSSTTKKGKRKSLKKKKKAPESSIQPSSLVEQQRQLARLGYISRCIPFLVCLECSSGDSDDEGSIEESHEEGSSMYKSDSEEVLGRVFKWYASVLQKLDAAAKNKNEEEVKSSPHAHIVQSLILESFSKSAAECHKREISAKTNSLIEKTLAKAKACANSLLFLFPKSIWVVRGVAAVTNALSSIDPGSKLNDRSNDTFELLVSNLAESNHFLRFYTLQILESYPARPFTTDHADLDLTDDLEEEPSYRPPQTEEDESNKNSALDGSAPASALSGACDVISMLKILEAIPIALPNERKLTSQLSRVEVYARTGKLPIVYAEAVACHMLGLLHVKFAPIWPVAVRVIVTLSLAQEGPAWPYIEVALKRSMIKHSVDESTDTYHKMASANDKRESCHEKVINQHLGLCVAFEVSRGKKTELFDELCQNQERNAQVSRHAVSDQLTLFESVWSIMENAPNLTSTKSKVVVPIYFEFLCQQYYVFHQDDPDLREIDFTGLVDSHSTAWPKEVLGRKSLQKKLESFLKMFAAVKGPQQLFKHKVLLQISVSFLANPDAMLSNLAFACVLRFKLPYLTPYVEYVQPMLKREGLREALTKLDLSKESELVDADHRFLLVPIVTRILFGRFSSRGNGAKKSSKDSPAARRAAILSFFSGIGNESGELSYFIYMMVRAFIPRDFRIETEGVQIEKETLARLIEASERITSEELTNVPIKRQEGFLNLLSDVITQIGFGMKHFVPVFMNLLIALCEQTEHALITSIKSQALKNELADDENIASEQDGSSRIGRIRSLSFLRLSDMFKKFASSVDFDESGERLWKSMSTSVVALPNTVINAENPPSLLQFIESIATHHNLIPLLHKSDEVVVAVFKCIAGTTRMKVMNCVLRIIDGLLTDGGTSNDANAASNGQSMGHALILQHIHMLIAQFTNRLVTESQIANLDEEISRGYANKKSKQSPTEGLQLNILCRVSELLVSTERANDDHITTMEDLCNLLVPLLKFNSHPNQLYLVRTVASLLPAVSIESAMSHFHALSKLLGPNKNQAGIASNEHRQIIASAISSICSRDLGCSKWKQVAKAVVDVNAVSASYVDEHDFERILPVLNGLGAASDAEGSWLNLSMVNMTEVGNKSKESKTFDGTRVLLPLIYTCFHLLYDSDGVVSRGSNKALKTLVTTSSKLALSNMDEKEERQNPWVKLTETTFVSSLKIGISTKEVATRRTFVLLISHVARHFSGFKSVHLYGDLNSLNRDDDQDLDFFLNLTHVQLHRRTRAFNRLQKLLATHEITSDQPPLFSDQSLGNILLPLTMHPVFEYKSKNEEAYVIGAIEAVGEISKHLPWSKYNNTLQSVLNNLARYPDQERFLIAMMCSMIDAFHFSVETGGETDKGQLPTSSQGNGVWRSLKNRIIPKVESFLLREKVDKHGSKVKRLRSSVVLALMKLFQKLPQDTFENKLPKLITVVCNAMKNRDYSERDTARDTLSKMAVSLDLKYLPIILSEMSVSLSEGYKLHIRSAALHSILVAISKVYVQPTVHSVDEIVALKFDRCIPAMMDLIHQDVFGKASEIKEVQHVQKRLIREALGSKSQDSLEIISKSIHFKPSIVGETVKDSFRGFTHASAVHALVTPFLDHLRDPDVSSSTMRKVKECLNRVVVGFSNNPTAKYDEVLPFVYATVAPFTHDKFKLGSDKDADLDDSDDEVDVPIQVSKSKQPNKSPKNRQKEVEKAVAVATWTPLSLGAAENQKSALDMKKNQKKELHKVTDGAAAPKLTGSSRHSPLRSSKTKTVNHPANACAVSFGLSLLNSSLKRTRLDVSDDDLCAMADPYLHLLTHCVRFSSDNQAVILSLRCLGVLLCIDLPSVPEAARDLGPSILDHLTASGAAANTQSEIVQCCFKTLTLLISHPKFSTQPIQQSNGAIIDDARINDSSHGESMPLTTVQMQALLSLLHSAVREFDHHNATFGLVKAISSKRFISAEFYDLMDVILKLSVQSQKSAIRLQSSQIFLQYLIEYPMGEQRMDNHLHQIVLNMKYEYEEGRLSAINLLSSVIQKFPLSVLEGKSQFFFLPLVLQLVNDESKKCKEAVADSISLLIQRISTESAQALFGYAKRWSQSSGTDSLPMQRASAQLFGIFVDSRPDYVKRGSNASDIISVIQDVMVLQIPFENESGWELLYHNLVCLEKLDTQMPSLLLENCEIWGALVELLAYPHPWIMQVSSRIISGYLSTVDPKELLRDGSKSFVVKIPGCLYKIARNMCRQLDFEDTHFVETISTLAIKTITWAFRAMKQHPDICYSDNGDEDHSSKDPCLWVMTRLSNIAKPKGIHRRESVFKCFAALCTSCNPEHLLPFLEKMIDPIDRSIREAANKLGPDEQAENDPQVALPKDVLQIIEDTCGTEQFVQAYAEVNRKVRDKRDKRKQDIASEAVHDPAAAAQRKITKHIRDKERKKRKIDGRRSIRGASSKRRYS